jgi:hypothetical protein
VCGGRDRRGGHGRNVEVPGQSRIGHTLSAVPQGHRLARAVLHVRYGPTASPDCRAARAAPRITQLALKPNSSIIVQSVHRADEAAASPFRRYTGLLRLGVC